MNYLAHLFLSPPDEDVLIGNLAGDFVSIAEYRFLEKGLKKGVDLHRRIDSFTDSHICVSQSIKRLSNEHGRYAAVIVDILYDHLLCRNWSKYSDENLIDFKSRVYEVFKRRHQDLPKRLQAKAPKMIERDFIEVYRSFDGMRKGMGYMDQRTSFPSDFVASIDHFESNITDYERDFNLFFPDLIDYAKKQYI